MSERERNQRTGVVAKALGLSAASIQAYARSGRIPCRKTPGDQYRFNVEEVREVLGTADTHAREDLVDVFTAPAGVYVDALSAYRGDPADEHSLRRERIGGAYLGRRPKPVVADAAAGSAELASLVGSAHGAAVAVLRREHASA